LNAEIGAPENPKRGDDSYHSLRTVDNVTEGMTGTRSYSVSGYFLPNAHRPNLHVLTEGLVTRLDVESDATVKGVYFKHDNKEYRVATREEVIVSAGTFKSPQILELSGIGNPTPLEAAGAKCVVENVRVGETLRPFGPGAGYELVDGEISMDMLQDLRPAQKAHVQYQRNQSGPLASTPLSVAFASYASFAIPAEVAALKECIMSARSPPQHQSAVLKILADRIADRIADPEDPTFRLIFFPATINVEPRCDGGDFFHPPPEQIGKMGTGIGLCLNRPLSVGTVHITSTSAEAAPQIDPAFLSHPADVELLSKGPELLAKVPAREPLSKKIEEAVCTAGVHELNG
jgi:choline dehydrogenase-like flavoprotein